MQVNFIMTLFGYRISYFLTKLFFLSCFFIFVTFLNSLPVEADSADCDRYYDMAMKLYRQKKSLEAEKVFSIAISKCPNVAKLYFQRAKLRQNYLGKYQEAIMDYTIVLKLNKNTKSYHPKSYYMRGLCWYHFGQYGRAVSDFSSCIKLNPKYDGRVRVARAKAFGKLGMVKNALQDLKNCSKFDPKYGQGQRAVVIQTLYAKIASGQSDY